MKRASPTHGARWLAHTNYDALMTHHTTETIWANYKFNISELITNFPYHETYFHIVKRHYDRWVRFDGHWKLINVILWLALRIVLPPFRCFFDSADQNYGHLFDRSMYKPQAMYPRDHDDVIKWKHICVTDPLCGVFTGHRWIPLTKASGAEPCWFLRFVPVMMSE